MRMSIVRADRHAPGALVLVAAVLTIAAAAPARAELAYFANGSYLSISSHRIEGDSLVLVLRAGGEIVCDPSVISRIAPDEVPYPEPQRQVSDGAVQDEDGGDAPFTSLIEQAAALHGVDARLLRAIIEAESGYDRRAQSPKGAMGLMQLMPETARAYAVEDPYDPAANIDAGARHLRALLDRFPVQEALAAYNAGESAVERFGGVPPYAETRSYVSRVLQLARLPR
jgi:soluble lytic murein transglycosylase-like protein